MAGDEQEAKHEAYMLVDGVRTTNMSEERPVEEEVTRVAVGEVSAIGNLLETKMVGSQRRERRL